MTRGSAPRHPSLARLDRQSVERPVGIRDVLGALVARLTEVFELDAQQDQLAYLVLFGRNSHTIARALDCSEARAKQDIAALFERTDTRSRQELFHLALRLANTPGAWTGAPLTPPPPPRGTVRSRGWTSNPGQGARRVAQQRSRM